MEPSRISRDGKEGDGVKTYLALNVPIRGLPVEHRGGNGNSQCNVVVRAKTKKQVGEILRHDVRYLNTYSSLHDVTGEKWDAIGVPDGYAYYQPGCCKGGWINDWFPIPTNKNR